MQNFNRFEALEMGKMMYQSSVGRKKTQSTGQNGNFQKIITLEPDGILKRSKGLWIRLVMICTYKKTH